MRTPLTYILAIFTLLLTSCESQPKKTDAEIYALPAFDPLSISPTPKITTGCELPQLDPSLKQEPRPEFPEASIRGGITGYVIYDFRINSSGHPEDIEFVTAKPRTIFEGNSRAALMKLVFSVDTRNSACLNQKYRVSYAYHLMSPCASNEFPSDMTAICTSAYFKRASNP